MANRGPNAGVTGAIVDISGTPIFWARVYRWQRQEKCGPVLRTKRGDTWERFRQSTPGATLAFSGKIQKDGYYRPMGTGLRGATGSIQLVFDNEAKESFNVTVIECTISEDEKKEDILNISIACVLTTPPVLAGFSGTQATTSAPASNVAEVHLGITKLVDPDTLDDADARDYDFESLTDTDAAETSAVLAVIGSAAATRAAMKIRNAIFQRTDAFGGTLTLNFDRTTSAEDVINANTYIDIDDQALTSHAASAAINDSTPAAPTGDNFVLRDIRQNELNDNNMLYVATYGKRSTKDDVEMPGSIPQDDPYDLEDEASITKETTSSTPPSVPSAPLGQHVKTISEQLTADNHWRHTFEYSNTNSQQKVEFAGTDTEEDPSDLQDEDRKTIVNESSTPPSTPTPTPSDLKLRRRVSRRIGGTPEKWSHTFEFARRTTQDDVEMDHTDTRTDPFELDAGGHITLVTNSATPPATPAAPTAGSVYVDTLVRQLHDSRWAHTFLYGPRTTADEAILPHQWTLVDPGDLDSEGEVAAIDSVPATPAGYYDRGVTGHYLTSTHILYVKKFGRRSTTQDIEMEHSRSVGTPFDGIQTETATVISSTDTPEAVALANFSTGTNFASVTARTLNDAKVLLIQATRDNPRIVLFEMRSPGEEPVRGFVDLFGFVRVYVRQIYQRANYWEYELAEQPLPLLRMRFGIRRRQTGEPIDMYWTLAGSSNNDYFLGLPAGTVTYRGINGQHNYTNGGPAEIFHEFEFLLIHEGGANCTGHLLFGKANLGWHRTEQDLSAISPGTWVKATDLYELADAFDSAALPQIDYSGVLA